MSDTEKNEEPKEAVKEASSKAKGSKASKPMRKTDDQAAYFSRGKLKLKGVDMKTSKKTGDAGKEIKLTPLQSASKLLQNRIAKKSDRYASVTLRDDDIAE